MGTGQALGGPRTRKTPDRTPPTGPPPTATSSVPNASRHPLRGVGSDNMIPAPVRSVPQNGSVVFTATYHYATGL